MNLAPGTKLGPYEILTLLGKGGMGEVYRATDTRLHREVAVKVSAEQFTKRFAHEARAIAALNHPSICTLHDVGPNYLVMELVEGETLAERIKQGPIPLDEALAIAGQVADALEAAHNKGIIHRDLKPGNIKIKPDGTVKVLDFGLAKMAEPAPAPDSDPGKSPTITLEAATRVGTILGTAAYMAPEQAKGKAVDKRADIWAFGVVLYEMLTGSRLFEGETVSETLASVLKEEPNLDKVPIRARRLVQVCLRKDPKQRLQYIGDARLLLEETTPTPTPRPRNWLPWAVAALCAAVAAAFAFLWLRAPAPEIRSTQFLLEAPGDTQFINSYTGTAVSPDGRYVVFAAGTPVNTRLWLRPLDSLSARPLQGTEGGDIAVLVPRQQVDRVLCERQIEAERNCGWSAAGVVRHHGCTWRDLEPRRVILFGTTREGLFRVPATGGVPQQITQLDAARKELGHFAPQFLPDGKRFLYFIYSADPNTQGIHAGSLDKPKERLRLLATERKAYYVPPRGGRMGFLLWLREQTLLAQRLDAARLRLEGDPTPLAEDVAVAGLVAAFWTSDAGLLVYRTRRCPLQSEDDLDEPGRQTPGRGGKGGPLLLAPDFA